MFNIRKNSTAFYRYASKRLMRFHHPRRYGLIFDIPYSGNHFWYDWEGMFKIQRKNSKRHSIRYEFRSAFKRNTKRLIEEELEHED
jgi:hypothetical protein